MHKKKIDKNRLSGSSKTCEGQNKRKISKSGMLQITMDMRPSGEKILTFWLHSFISVNGKFTAGQNGIKKNEEVYSDIMQHIEEIK